MCKAVTKATGKQVPAARAGLRRREGDQAARPRGARGRDAREGRRQHAGRVRRGSRLLRRFLPRAQLRGTDTLVYEGQFGKSSKESLECVEVSYPTSETR